MPVQTSNVAGWQTAATSAGVVSEEERGGGSMSIAVHGDSPTHTAVWTQAGRQRDAEAGAENDLLKGKLGTQMPQANSQRAQTLRGEIYRAEHSKSCKYSMAINNMLLQERLQSCTSC